MKTRSFYLLVMLLLAGAFARPAAAQVRANISFGYPPRAYYGPRYYAPRPPVVYAVPPPPPVCHAPRPVYCAPRPVYNRRDSDRAPARRWEAGVRSEV